MAYIESHQELARHPKTKRLARALHVNIREAIGALHMLWWWCLDYAEDGCITEYSNEDIADALLWEGDAAILVEALIESGFIDEEGQGRYIHDWYDYAGMLIERREKNKERMRNARAKRETPTINSVQNTCDAQNEHVQDTCGATVPNQTVPNQTKTKQPDPVIAQKPEAQTETTATPPPTKNVYVESSDEYQLALKLKDRVYAQNPRAKIPKTAPQIQAWAKVFSPLLARGYTREEIEQVMQFAYVVDTWWSQHPILAASTFAEKFDKIFEKMKGQSNGKTGQYAKKETYETALPSGVAGNSQEYRSDRSARIALIERKATGGK